MFRLNAKIKVYETISLIPTPKYYEFNYVKDVTIESSYKNLTDTATIVMPKRVFKDSKGFNEGSQSDINDFMKKTSIHDYLKLESFVEIFLGYDGDYKPAFRGFITGIEGDNPVRINCEDSMYAFKKIKAVATEIKKNDKDTMNTIAPNPSMNVDNFNPKTFFESRIKKLKLPIKVNALDEDLGNLVINRNQSLAQVFEMLNDKGIYTYFKMEKLQPVLTISNNPQQYGIKEIGSFIDRNFIENPLVGSLAKGLINKGLDLLGPKLTSMNSAFSSTMFGKNIRFKFRHNIISDNLKVVKETTNNSRIRVEKFFNNSNIPLFAELGNPDGQLLKKYVLHNDDNSKELPTDQALYKKKSAEIAAELYQYAALRALELKPSGLSGSFTTFGEPFVRPTDRVILENAKEKEKNGTFQVEKVERTFGSNGYRQTITLGRRVEI